MNEPKLSKKRLLIFVIAYHAEATLKWVLERIPRSIFDNLDAQVLVVDDASVDRTFEIGCQYRDDHPEIQLTVLRNSYNQGYGGNQKIGYEYAVTQGFDYVAMVHGDGQYAPEELPRLLEPLLADTADAVFGSRMIDAGAARKGGMPLYKFIGNRVLTAVQNALLSTQLSEFHSGYRIYSVGALRQIPFSLNSNEFHFDTEIIIQLVNAKLRIRELSIPTYYGDEICRVNGMKYAKNVLVATAKNVAHRAGLFYQRRFDVTPNSNTHYDLKLGYPSSHTYALNSVPHGARVIDLGSGPGGIATELLRRNCEVAVVDRYPPSLAPEDPRLTVLVQDLNETLGFGVDSYRYILMLDIIEHLRDPELFLADLRKQFDFTERTIVLTTPNVAFFVQRLLLLLGQFNYGKAGILDRTHTRLFTFHTLKAMLEDAGLRIQEFKGIPAPFPKVLGNRALGRLALRTNLALIKVSRTLFSYQIFVVAKTTPEVSFILNDTRRNSVRPRAAERNST